MNNSELSPMIMQQLAKLEERHIDLDAQGNKIIAIDVDGVLLDYSLAYRHAWAQAFGDLPDERDPNAYWPLDRWAVHRLEGERKRQFRSKFDETFWSTIPPLPGALEACTRLNHAGYTLVFVTAMKPGFEKARLKNIQNLGITFSDLIVTSMSEEIGNPKANILNKLKPLAFVDDYAPYLRGLEPGIHKALIHRHPNGSPNVGEDLALADSSHKDLDDFARWWEECEGARK